MPRDRRPTVAVALFVGAAALYARSLPYPFVNLDDPHYVFANPHITGGLTAANVGWAFTTGEQANWHPLTWLSLQLDSTLWGGDAPAGFRATNVLLHAANAVLLFLFLDRATGAVGRSAVVAALWAAHPLHVESVVWISERKDVLSQFFALLSLIAYVRYAERPTAGRYLLVAGLLALGLMAKPMLVTLPCVFLLLDHWPLRRGLRVVEKLPLFALAAASSVATLVVQDQGGAVGSLERLGPADRLANAVAGYGQYLRQTVWPADLAIIYPFVPRSLADPEVWAAAVVLAFVTAWVVHARRRYPYLVVGLLWFLGTLVPVIGVVQVGSQARADRYTYLPHVGLFVAGVWGAADLLKRSPRAQVAAAAVAVAAAAGACWVQVGHWRTDLSLWDHAITATGPDNPLARLNRGQIVARTGGPAAALDDAGAAVRLAPGNAAARRFLGGVLAELGDFNHAARHLEQAVRLRPDDAEGRVALANVLVMAGRATEAAPHFRAAGATGGLAPLANVIAEGQELLNRGDVAAARERFARAAAAAPKLGEPRAWLDACDVVEKARQKQRN
jgi:tetratricopeptide (TPR) repeat protein